MELHPPQGQPAIRPQATILVVDDTPSNIQILAYALMKQYTIRTATSGPAALRLLQEDVKPDLILLDVMMPEMDGFEVCRRIKQDPATWNIPVIFVTAKDDVTDQQLGFDLGAVDYVTKPINILLLQARIALHLRLKQKSDQLERLALLDALTDIPNRRALEDMLARECGRAKRDRIPLSVLMIDVDHFKAFNDHYGHGAGDECLRRIAQGLESALRRPGDFVARYGGEEFAVVLPDCDQAGAMTVAETLRQGIEALNIVHAQSSAADHVTLSVGVATGFDIDDGACQDLLTQADHALYQAKQQGRNRVAAT